MRRSTYAFCHGDRGAVTTSWICIAAMVEPTSVNKQVPRHLVLGKGVAELLGRPCGGGMVGDGDMDDSSPVVREDYEDEQQLVGDCRHDEEISSHDLADMVGQERSPWL